MTDINDDPFLNPRKERLVEADGQNMYVPKAGFFDGENWSAGFGLGQKYTSYSLLSDIGLQFGDKEPTDTIDPDDWNETHPYWQEDINHDQSLTLDVARNIFFTRARSENYRNLQQRSTTGGMVARGTGIFLGAAVDPINIVAAPAATYAKAGLLGKMLWAGGANMVVEGALQGVAYATQDVRGEELGYDDVAWNMVAAAGIGAAFPVAGRTLSKLFTSKKVTTTPNDADAPKVDYKQSTKQKVQTQSGHNKVVKHKTIDTTDFASVNSIKFNTKGRVATEGDTVTVTRSPENQIAITGKAEDVVKLLPTLSAKLDGFENINVKFDGAENKVYNNADELTKDIKNIETQTGVKAERDVLDTTTNEFRFKDKGYKIEFDENGNLTGRVFETTSTGKAKKKPLPEQKANEIIRANQEQIKTTRNATNKKFASPETNTKDYTYNTTVDSKLNAKKNYSTQTQVDASVSGQRKQFIENHGDTETNYKALINSEVIKAKDWFSAGYFINRAGERIDLTQTRVADLTADERGLLGKRLGIRRSEIPTNAEGFVTPTGRGAELRKKLDRFDEESRALENEKTVLRDYLNCVRING